MHTNKTKKHSLPLVGGAGEPHGSLRGGAAADAAAGPGGVGICEPQGSVAAAWTIWKSRDVVWRYGHTMGVVGRWWDGEPEASCFPKGRTSGARKSLVSLTQLSLRSSSSANCFRPALSGTTTEMRISIFFYKLWTSQYKIEFHGKQSVIIMQQSSCKGRISLVHLVHLTQIMSEHCEHLKRFVQILEARPHYYIRAQM